MPAQLPLTVEDVRDAAQAIFEAGERVDMGQLAADLGMAKATLYRWVGSREALLSQVMARLANAAFDEALAHAASASAPGGSRPSRAATSAPSSRWSRSRRSSVPRVRSRCG